MKIKNRIYLYIILFLSMTAMAIFSSMWVSPQNQLDPPGWAVLCALLSFLIGSLFLSLIIIDIYKSLRDYGGRLPGTRADFFYDFNNFVPEADSIFEQFKLNMGRGEIRPNTSLFVSQIEEIGTEYKALVRKYFMAKRNGFFKIIVIGIVAVILIFSSLYIADYTIDTALTKEAGFKDTIIPKGGIPECLIDGLYYSVVTFATLGYGDIHPTQSILARIISILEVLIFIFLVGIGINVAFNLMPISSIVTPENLKDVLREELEKVAEAAYP